LESFERQLTLGLFTYNVIVVDNDHRRTASAVVRRIEPKKFTIRYDIEPKKNIALARNKCLNLCMGDYIAMIDDDERAEKDWLLNLYLAALKYQADIVLGRVKAIFPPKTPEYIRKSLIFDLRRPISGAIVDMEFYGAGNAFFKRSIIETTSIRFDPQFGKTGGEDTRFFGELRQKGYLSVWCNEAVVYHYYPQSRASLRWILQRAFRLGNNSTRLRGDTHWLRSRSPHHIDQLSLSVKNLSKSTFKFLASLLNAKLASGYKTNVVNQLSPLAFYFGEILSLFNYRYHEYR
jgi:succinoglycan biosynthesis protein ExoM